MKRFIRLELPAYRDTSTGATLMKFVTSQNDAAPARSSLSAQERAALRERARAKGWFRWLMSTDNNSKQSHDL